MTVTLPEPSPLSPSPEPFCPLFRVCGGCSAQHIPYALQLSNKAQVLKRAAGFEDVKSFSGGERGYRNRLDLVFHEGGLGFRAKGRWWKVIDVPSCPIANEKINELITEIRSAFPAPDYFHLKKQCGTFRYAVIRAPKNDSSISFVLNSDSPRLQEAITEIEEYAKDSSAANIAVTYVGAKSGVSVSDEFFMVKGEKFLRENYLGKDFLFSIQGFFQTNTKMTDKLHRYCRGLIDSYDTKDTHLLDLYGGVGTFGILNSGCFKGTTTVESVPECTEAAKINIKNNSAENVEALCLDAKRLKNLPFPSPLFVITDPPRSGMHPKTIETLKNLAPRVILYISCNLKQLGADIAKFDGYSVKSAALFDLFPQTPHAEGVVELVRK